MVDSTIDERPAFKVGQVFLQGAAFAHRRPPLGLPADTPHHPQQINVTMGMLNLNNGEASQVVVAVTTVPDDGDEKALYDFQVEMCAVVYEIDRITFPDQQLAEVVAVMLYPFIREAVANITGRGRFGPIWLNPFNVRKAMADALVAQQAAQAGMQNPAP